MLKKFINRIKSQKGMSGVLVALLLVMVGVGLVAGIQTFMEGAKTDIQNEANSTIDSVLVEDIGGTDCMKCHY